MAEENGEGEKTLGAKQVATRIGTDARTFRKFLRATNRAVGQGGRYDFPESELKALKAQFTKWRGTKPAAKPDEPEKLEVNGDLPRRSRTPKAKKGDARVFPSDERTDEEIEEAFEAELAADEELDLELDEDGLDLEDEVEEDDDVEELEI